MEHVQIDDANNEVKLKFNMDFYNINPILLASKDFTKNFWISLEQNSNSIFVHMQPKPEFFGKVNLNDIAFEFYNYALGIMQSSLISNKQKSL